LIYNERTENRNDNRREKAEWKKQEDKLGLKHKRKESRMEAQKGEGEKGVGGGWRLKGEGSPPAPRSLDRYIPSYIQSLPYCPTIRGPL